METLPRKPIVFSAAFIAVAKFVLVRKKGAQKAKPST